MAVKHHCLPPRLARFNVFDLLRICGFLGASITSCIHLVNIMVSRYMLHVFFFLSFLFFCFILKRCKFLDWVVPNGRTIDEY
jgi:hypothetical protein